MELNLDFIIYEDSVDQDQTAHSVQSDLGSTRSTSSLDILAKKGLKFQ